MKCMDPLPCHCLGAPGRNEPLGGPRGGHLLHPPARRLHRRPSDQHPQLRRQVPPADPHRRAEQHLVNFFAVIFGVILKISCPVKCSLLQGSQRGQYALQKCPGRIRREL